MTYAHITGWGKCIPPARISNDEISQLVDTNDEWITTRTGIKARRVSHVSTAELATVAAKHAIACAGIDAKDIDLVLLATCTPSTMVANTASLVQKTLGQLVQPLWTLMPHALVFYMQYKRLRHKFKPV